MGKTASVFKAKCRRESTGKRRIEQERTDDEETEFCVNGAWNLASGFKGSIAKLHNVKTHCIDYIGSTSI